MTDRKAAQAKVWSIIDDHIGEYIEDIRTAMRQPSVSQSGEGIEAMATLTENYLQSLGARTSQAAGQRAPIVEGWLGNAADRPTLLFYDLYDVQPAADQPGWTVDPFAAEIVTDEKGRQRIVGRGAFNSKGPLFGALATLKAFRDAGVDLPVNIRFLIEGEEEIGSPSLPGYLAEHHDELTACDAALIPYFAGNASGETLLRLGFKGLALLRFEVEGGEWGGPQRGDIHALHGALVASPAWQLVKALATLVNDDESLAVEGLHDITPLPSVASQQLIANAARCHDFAQFQAEVGCRLKRQAPAGELLRESMFGVALNIDAFDVGHFEDGEPATLIPKRARAFADLRLPPGVEPYAVVALFRQHLDERGFAHVKIDVQSSYPAAACSADEPVVAAMIAACQTQSDCVRVYPLHAGAAPMYLFSMNLGLPFAFGGVGHGAGSHGPNEYIMRDDVAPFMKAMAAFLFNFADKKA